MHEGTQRLCRELREAVLRGRALITAADDAKLYQRPGEASWSAAECVEHLSLTAEKYNRRIRRMLETAKTRPAGGPAKHTIIGRILLSMMEPPVRRKLPAPKGFVPGSGDPRDVLLARYEAAHEELIKLIEETDAIDRTRVKVPSPATNLIRISLHDAFALISAHTRRHLWQAERALAG
jgi:hypothetical protein